MESLFCIFNIICNCYNKNIVYAYIRFISKLNLINNENCQSPIADYKYID